MFEVIGASETRIRVVVVGNGMVGHRFCEELLTRAGGDRFELIVLGEEPRPAYDRVHLSEFFAGKTAADLMLTDRAWYDEQGAVLHLGESVREIDRHGMQVVTDSGLRIGYDKLVLATGSAPFVPPLPGVETPGVFVYRTLEDLEAIQAWAGPARTAAVIGGGLLGLEAAKALVDLKLETHVVEFADRLMPRQVDHAGGGVLRRAIEELGVKVHLDARTEAILGDEVVTGLRFQDASELPIDMLVISAGIRPRDELARDAGIRVGERGGIEVDQTLTTSDPDIHAIGESALYGDMIYGLVAPGYEMAAILAKRLCGGEDRFEGADMSTKLKLMGVDVASFGDITADHGPVTNEEERPQCVVFEDGARGVYQKVIVSHDHKKLLGGILVGDASAYMQLSILSREGKEFPGAPHELLLPAATGGDASGALTFSDETQVCSCNGVSKGDLVAALREGEITDLAELKTCTGAGTGCGGCVPFVKQILDAELAMAGIEVSQGLCEHFGYSRKELFWIIKLGRIKSFDALLLTHGRGAGCEVCRPVVASILASAWNDLIVNHSNIQDTNDKFLANIQRGGTYSVIPRVPGGEVTPEKLIVLGEVAKKYDLYCKITGGQRIDLLGARVEELPEIWEELVAAGFESGHAYGKAMRTVKSCIGTNWCRFGVQDSTAFAIHIEERYRGIRAPHKIKSAVSGCIRECAEAQNKDFGIIATEEGWNLYVCGNGGSNPRHGDLLATNLDDESLIRYVDRFLMFYIQTAKPLQRTARWLEELEGGIDYLRKVVIDDKLDIAHQLEADMQQLVDTYKCEWTEVVNSPERRAMFRHFAEEGESDESLARIVERGQSRPADWPRESSAEARLDLSPEAEWVWRRVCATTDVPANAGISLPHGKSQIAVFNFESRGEWYATQNQCPHRKDMILARGMIGSQGAEPKVACPFHKKTFSLETGKGLSDPEYAIDSFPVEIRDGDVFVKLPAEATFLPLAGCSKGTP